MYLYYNCKSTFAHPCIEYKVPNPGIFIVIEIEGVQDLNLDLLK